MQEKEMFALTLNWAVLGPALSAEAGVCSAVKVLAGQADSLVSLQMLFFGWAKNAAHGSPSASCSQSLGSAVACEAFL